MITKSWKTVIRQLTLSTCVFLASACQDRLPPSNVIVILVDDLGWNDVGYQGSTFYETPNIDALASESYQFSDAYSSGAVCSPSRAAIMTGLHPVRLNITDWIPGQDPQDRVLRGPKDLDHLPLEHVTLAEAMQARGYATMFSGKWHLGSEGYFPEDQGFILNVGGHHRGSPPGGYYVPYKNPKMEDGPEGEYLTDRLTDEVLSFIDGADEQPFFAFLSFYSVHTPIQPNKDFIDYFDDKARTLTLPDTMFVPEGGGRTTIRQHDPEYASMVYAMDANIGRLIRYLKVKGLYDKTSIIFTSDNGGLSTLESHRSNTGPTSVRPLRAGKGWLYEGGIRVPLLIKPAFMSATPSIIKEPVIGHDLFPTILSLIGESDGPLESLGGIDLVPLMKGSSTDGRDLWWHYPHYHGSAWTPGAAIRQGDWKLVEFYEDDRVELYSLSEDISESRDLSEVYPDIRDTLQSRLRELQREAGAKWPVQNN